VEFKNHFSSYSSEYRRYRPDYPAELYAFIFTQVSRFECAWDAATGNGQVALALARKFKQVYANDASMKQLENAARNGNIEYFVSRVEYTPLPDGSIDLVSIAQALHWFDHEEFYREVRRVSEQNAVIAAWAYGLLSIDPDTDRIIRRFNDEIVAPFWPQERAYVDRKYETIPFPFKKIVTPQFFILRDWSLHELLGYISTWSGVRRYMMQTVSDPLHEINDELTAVWGNPETKKHVTWPIYLLMGKVHDS